MTKNVSANAGEMVFPHPLFVPYDPENIHLYELHGAPLRRWLWRARSPTRHAARSRMRKAIFVAGKDYGMRELGQVAYMLNHTEDGFSQAYYRPTTSQNKEVCL